MGGKPKELRYKHAGRTRNGRLFDLVAVIAENEIYTSSFAEIRNGVSGKLGNINFEVTVTPENNGVQMTDVVFAIQDSLTGEEVVLDKYEMDFYDFDVNKHQTLSERLCINRDQFDMSQSHLPSDGDVKVSNSNSDCDGKASQSGSVTIESQGVGFLCDNPTYATDLADVESCLECFNEKQCTKVNGVSKYFPISRDQRTAKITLTSTSKFTVSLGVGCAKAVGETCNRNFLFSGFYDGCNDTAAPETTTTAPSTTTTASD